MYSKPTKAPSMVRPIIGRELFRALTTVDNRKATIHVLIRMVALTFSVCGAAVAFEVGQYELFLVLLPVIGIQANFLGWAGLGHELAHGTVFKSKSLNRALFIMCSALNWSNFKYYWISHSAHHKYTLFGNFDGEGRSTVTINIPHAIAALTFDLFHFYRSAKILLDNAVGTVRGGWAEFLFPNGSVERRELIQGARQVLAGHLGLMLLFVLSGKIYLIFLISLSPFFCTFPNKILSISQHYNAQTNNVDFRFNSRSISLPPIFRFLYANMNYHVEHHIYPTVPFYNLPLLSAELMERSYLTEPSDLMTYLKELFDNRASKREGGPQP
jgi:fatty acid desaturase